ncbi:MAG: hypothetical protein QOF83_1258 [Solirubrobacteraceae bacterium]|nr:hypothetical protein [Solirubrobacteraceae bacterium]
MTDSVTISALATAGGTLVLAVATFSSVRSANRSARVAELSLLTGLRPVLIPTKDADPVAPIRFGDGEVLHVAGHGGAIVVANDVVYLGMGVRNGGQGLGVIHGWRAEPRDVDRANDRPDLESFRRQQIDIYIPAGDTGLWLGALRDRSEPAYAPVRGALDAQDADGTIVVDLLYGDHEGGQRTIVRFILAPWSDEEGQAERSARRVTALRYWNVDRADPR